jgi:spore maturation protein SpmA
MALSRIWSAFILIAITIAGLKYVTNSHYKNIFSDLVIGKSGDTIKVNVVANSLLTKKVVDSISINGFAKEHKIYYKPSDSLNTQIFRVQEANGVINTSKDAVELSIGLIGMLTLLMGFMSIAEKAGGISLLSRWIQPFFGKLFPEIPKGHPAFGHMMMNFSANLLGLDNAATPFGLKAMQSLQEINPNKDTASNAQIMFLCLHASGLTLIPMSIIAMRSTLKAGNPTDIFLPCMIATFVATIAAMLIVSFKQKINIFQPVILLYIGGISVVIGLLVTYLTHLNKEDMDSFSKALSNGILLFIFLAIILGALYKKINVLK